MNIPYYDKEIIKAAAKESGFDENIFSFYDERPTRSFLYNVSTEGFSSVSGNGATLEDQIFQYQFNAIRKAAEEGSCIIVGRCSDYILREYPGLLTVFLHADDKFRMERVSRLYGFDEKSAAKEIKGVDKKRARFHNFYSEAKWGEASAYDLSVNVSKIGVDETVELIAYYVNTKFKS